MGLPKNEPTITSQPDAFGDMSSMFKEFEKAS